MKRKSVFNLVFCALACALCAVLSQIVIPTPFAVPLTLQTFIFALIGYVFGAKRGLAVAFLYLAMGAIGIPVFSGFRGGIGCIFGDLSGGFLVGFLPLTALCGIREYIYHSRNGRLLSALTGIAGVLLCHMCGIAFYHVITKAPLLESVVIASLPFIFKDLVLCIAAYLLSGKLIKVLKKNIPDFKP